MTDNAHKEATRLLSLTTETLAPCHLLDLADFMVKHDVVPAWWSGEDPFEHWSDEDYSDIVASVRCAIFNGDLSGLRFLVER